MTVIVDKASEIRRREGKRSEELVSARRAGAIEGELEAGWQART